MSGEYNFTVAYRRRLIRCAMSAFVVEELSGRPIDQLKPLGVFDDNLTRIHAIVRDQFLRHGAFCQASLIISIYHVICAELE